MQPSPQSSTETLLPARQVFGRYGVVDRTIARWLDDENLKFPRPLVINSRRYWRLADLQEWERSRASSKREAA